jgi:hypothetical protein
MNITSLKEIGSIMKLKTDETIIQQGELGEEMYILLKGRVEVVLNSEFVGHEVKIAELSCGDVFGEMSMIENKTRSATVRALENCTVFRIHKDKFADFIMKDTSVAIKMLRILSKRLVDIRDKSTDSHKAALVETAKEDIVEVASEDVTVKES